MTTKRYTDDFLTFWVKYPSRWNRDSDRFYKVGKWEAMQEWKKMSPEEKQQALVAVRYLRRGQYVLDAHRWLKKRRFEDIEPPNPKEIARKKVEERERWKQEKREEFGSFLQEQTTEKLKKTQGIRTGALRHLGWLIDEILDARNRSINALKSAERK